MELKSKRGRPKRGDVPVKSIGWQLPPTIRLSRDTVIKDIDFIKAMRNASRPFIPVKDMTLKQRMNMSHQVEAKQPTIEDIKSERL